MEPLAHLLTAALQQVLDSGLEPEWLSTLLTALPKPGKSTTLVKNLRPISVISAQYRLIMLVFVAHLRVGLHDVLSPE